MGKIPTEFWDDPKSKTCKAEEMEDFIGPVIMVIIALTLFIAVIYFYGVASSQSSVEQFVAEQQPYWQLPDTVRITTHIESVNGKPVITQDTIVQKGIP